MLRIHVVHVGGHDYYLAGREMGTDLEEPGVWAGPAAGPLGLAGEVEPGPFSRLMGGRDPRTDRPLRPDRGDRQVEAYDLTFCAPKSVSLLEALGPGEIADAAREGHRRAVEDAGSYLSRQAVGVRRQRDGMQVSVPSTGMVAGEFGHRISRALDPHLHTHLVAANLAQGVDGAWSSVEGRRLFGHLPAAARLYHARLRLELTERLGAGWEVRPSGFGDVVGVDRGLRRLFSQRTAAIDEYMITRYGPSASRSPGAAAATRPAKVLDASLADLAEGWRERAADLGYDLGELARVVGRGRSLPGAEAGGPQAPDRLAASLLGRHRPGWVVSRADLVGAVAAGTARGATAEGVEGVVDRLTARLAPADTLPRAREPRWRVEEVVDLVRARGPALVEVEPPGRSRSRAGRTEPGVDREPTRGRDRSEALRRRGPGLER